MRCLERREAGEGAISKAQAKRLEKAKQREETLAKKQEAKRQVTPGAGEPPCQRGSVLLAIPGPRSPQRSAQSAPAA